MQLLPTLSHMPFKVGDDLLFCHSDGPMNFIPEQTFTAESMLVPPQIISFQPWRLARLRINGSVEMLTAPGMAATSPTQVFCNPVVSDGKLSFIHGRTLWSSPLGNGFNLQPVAVKSGIFAGFFRGGKAIYVTPSAPGVSGSIVPDPYGTIINLPLTNIVRVVPSGPEDLIVTGFDGPDFVSLLWRPRQQLQRITVNGGENVYKCCIDGSNVIYAKKVGPEETYLHIDPIELTPY